MGTPARHTIPRSGEATVRILEALASAGGGWCSEQHLGATAGVDAADLADLVTVLERAGYVRVREGDRACRLGPAVIELANATTAGTVGLAAAKGEIDAVSADLELPASVASLTGRSVEVVERSQANHPAEAHIGQHVPFAPPFGAVFAAFGDDTTAARWLAGTGTSGDLHDRHHELLDAVRAERVAVLRLDEAMLDLHEALSHLAANVLSTGSAREVEAVLDRLDGWCHQPPDEIAWLDGEALIPVDTVSSPVLDLQGSPRFSLQVHVRDLLQADELRGVVCRLRSAALRTGLQIDLHQDAVSALSP